MKIKRTTNHGKARWRVAFVELGQERRRFFETKQAAEAFAADRETQQDEYGAVWLAATAAMRKEAAEAIVRARDGGYTLAEACRAFEAARTATAGSMTLSELQRLFLDAKRAQGLRDRLAKFNERAVAVFVRGREAVPAASITPTDIATHLDRPNWSGRTRQGVLINLGTFFGWCVRMEHLTRNPCANVPRPVVETKPKCIHHAADVEKILRTAERLDPEMVGYGAVGYLAGLRPDSEMARLPRANIRDGFIRIEEWTKTRRRRDVTICPALGKWLAKWLPIGVELAPPRARDRWARIRKAAGFVSREQDVMRHTFVSAHYVLHGEAATSAQAGHSAQELHASYRELMTRAEAEAIFAIGPDPGAEYQVRGKVRRNPPRPA